MYRESTEPEPLLIPNVRVTVAAPPKPILMGFCDGRFSERGVYEYPEMYEDQRSFAGRELERLAKRDWRKIRSALLRSDLENFAQAADWLHEAGYFPSGELLEHSAAVLTVLREHRDVLIWLMRLDIEQFRHAIRAATRLFKDQQAIWAAHIDAGAENRRLPKLKSPYEDFHRTLKFPPHLNFKLLQAYLLGTGKAPRLLATFQWDASGTPSVTVNVDSPLEAIGLSVHIDKNFSARQWMTCANCKAGFEKHRGDGRFCSPRCKNYYTTNARRRKIKLLQQSIEAWGALSADQRSSRDRWRWVAEWVTRQSAGEFDIEVAWANKEAHKMKGRK